MGTPAERIEEIMDLMRSNRWNHVEQRHMIERHGVSRAVMSRDAAEAARTLGAIHMGTPEQREESRGMLLARLNRWKRRAMTSGRDGNPDMGAIARLEDIEAKIVGAYAPVKIESTGDAELAKLPALQLIVQLIQSDPALLPALQKQILEVGHVGQAEDGGTGEGDARPGGSGPEHGAHRKGKRDGGTRRRLRKADRDGE